MDEQAYLDREAGLERGLSKAQIIMIGLGGAIGTGLFMGAGSRLHDAGPGLFIVYAVCGIFVFFSLRALGELVLHRPSSGSFVSYAREFFGEKTAFVTGWLYFFNWAATAVVDVTAVALYVHYWSMFEAIPQWLIALIALCIVLTMNVISVKLFGEMEFWASIIKVTALIAFLVVGMVFLAGRFDIDGQQAGISVITDNGGLFPEGIFPLCIVTSGVIRAYAAVELVGIAAGETEDPPKVMPRAINSVIVRIAVFYVGSVLLLALLLPYTAYRAGESPFVTFFSKIGMPAAGGIMNLVVLTAALSSLNAGLYSTGRILRSMAMNGSGPAFTGKMNRNGVPFGGIALTGALTLLGIILNLFVPEDAFNIALDLSALGIISTWAMIVACQIQLYRWERKGILERPAFRLPGAPYTSYVTLLFLAAVTVLMCYENIWNLIAILVIIPMLIVGWYAVRGKVMTMAAAREGYTGDYPVVPQPPVPEAPHGRHQESEED